MQLNMSGGNEVMFRVMYMQKVVKLKLKRQ